MTGEIKNRDHNGGGGGGGGDGGGRGMTSDVKNRDDNGGGGGEGDGGIDMFNALPEGCIANAVSLTSHLDACRLSLVTSTFRSAVESDAVWERFLPSDYQDILARVVAVDSLGGDDGGVGSVTPLSFPTKKDLYLHLCDHPIIIDGGTKSFSLEKMSGKKCFMLAARSLSIVWGDTPRYWKWTPLPESRFAEVAELKCVCWFEIHGSLRTNMLSPSTTYAAYLVFKSAGGGASGFEHKPAEVSVGVIGGESETKKVYLDSEGGRRQRVRLAPRRIGRLGIFNNMPNRMMAAEVGEPTVNDDQHPKKRVDGWLEIELGEYVSNGAEKDVELEMSVLEVKGGHWKSGLLVQGIEIRPKHGSNKEKEVGKVSV